MYSTKSMEQLSFLYITQQKSRQAGEILVIFRSFVIRIDSAKCVCVCVCMRKGDRGRGGGLCVDYVECVCVCVSGSCVENLWLCCCGSESAG